MESSSPSTRQWASLTRRGCKWPAQWPGPPHTAGACLLGQAFQIDQTDRLILVHRHMDQMFSTGGDIHGAEPYKSWKGADPAAFAGPGHAFHLFFRRMPITKSYYILLLAYVKNGMVLFSGSSGQRGGKCGILSFRMKYGCQSGEPHQPIRFERVGLVRLFCVLQRHVREKTEAGWYAGI